MPPMQVGQYRTINLASGSGRFETFSIAADLPGVAIAVRAVHWMVDSPGTAMAGGLVHGLTSPIPGDRNDIIDQSTAWSVVAWNANGPCVIPLDIPDGGYLMAGPQGVQLRNDSGSTHSFSIFIYYYPVRMSILEYSLLRRRTSFEEGE